MVCRAEPDGDAGCDAEDWGEDGGGFGLVFPEDGEDHGEDARACYHACILLARFLI